MPSFEFTPYRSPFANSIAEMILRRGDIAARQAEQIGGAQARAAESIGAAQAGAAQLSGQAWARGLLGAGDAVSGAIQHATDPRRKLEQIQLARAQQLQKGEGAVDAMMQSHPLPSGAAGPQAPSYLTSDGLFDIPKMNQALAGTGMAHLAPELLKGAESINDGITKHRALEQQAAQQHTLLLGDLAEGALKLSAIGMPLEAAMDFVVRPALATKRFQPDEYAQIKQQIMSLPPEQQQQALGTLMDAAAKLGGNKTLAPSAQEVDRYGRVIAKGAERPVKLSPTDLAIKAAQGDQEAIKALALLKPGPKRTETEQALDAYAVSIGKQNASQLTDADRMAYEKRKAAIGSDQAFRQHQRERQYDIANPIPEKAANQDKLEQQYRTILARAMSNRSGGIGLEDQKVQQANHLLALLEQTYDPKTDSYNLPKTLQGELAAGLARLVAPGGNVGIEMMREFDQRTAKGDLAGALTYVTGHPFPTATQDFAKLLKESIERQGAVAEQNREGSMGYLRGLVPTELEESRRLALEANNLNPLRRSRMATGPNGERRLVVSVDGGKTWK